MLEKRTKTTVTERTEKEEGLAKGNGFGEQLARLEAVGVNFLLEKYKREDFLIKKKGLRRGFEGQHRKRGGNLRLPGKKREDDHQKEKGFEE